MVITFAAKKKMLLAAASVLASLMLLAWGSTMSAATTPVTASVVLLPGSQGIDRWRLDYCPLRKEGCPIGSRSVAEAWLFGFWVRRLAARSKFKEQEMAGNVAVDCP